MNGKPPASNPDEAIHEAAQKKCGYVAIVGRPNVGKSTLLNHLLGQKVSITSRKPQTTRHNLLGILTEGNAQVLFVDTPGMHSNQPRAINRYMNKSARNALKDVDLVLFLVDRDRWTEDDQMVLGLVKSSPAKLVVAINKIDRMNVGPKRGESKQGEKGKRGTKDPSGSPDRKGPSGSPDRKDPSGSPDRKDPSGSPDRKDPSGSPDKRDKLLPLITQLGAALDKAFGGKEHHTDIIPISALQGENLDKLRSIILDNLPASPFYFDEDQVTDRSVRFMVAEIIREKLMRQLGDELPYAVTIQLERFEQQPGIIHIDATILVEKESQKGIVVGSKGARIRRVGMDARRDIEALVQTKVMLNTWVKVKASWSDDERALVSLGYGAPEESDGPDDLGSLNDPNNNLNNDLNNNQNNKETGEP